MGTPTRRRTICRGSSTPSHTTWLRSTGVRSTTCCHAAPRAKTSETPSRVKVGGVVPGELQAAVLDAADDVEGVGAVGLRAHVRLKGPDPLDEPALVGGPVELAQVVEAHRGGEAGDVCGAEVAQGPVAQAP